MSHNQTTPEVKQSEAVTQEGGLKWYLNGTFKFEEQHPLNEKFQKLSRGLLDFLKNIALVGALKYFAKKTDSHLLLQVSNIALLLTMVPVWMSLSRAYFNPFFWMKNLFSKPIDNMLRTILAGIIGLMLLLTIYEITDAIVAAQLAHNP